MLLSVLLSRASSFIQLRRVLTSTRQTPSSHPRYICQTNGTRKIYRLQVGFICCVACVEIPQRAQSLAQIILTAINLGIRSLSSNKRALLQHQVVDDIQKISFLLGPTGADDPPFLHLFGPSAPPFKLILFPLYTHVLRLSPSLPTGPSQREEFCEFFTEVIVSFPFFPRLQVGRQLLPHAFYISLDLAGSFSSDWELECSRSFIPSSPAFPSLCEPSSGLTLLLKSLQSSSIFVHLLLRRDLWFSRVYKLEFKKKKKEGNPYPRTWPLSSRLYMSRYSLLRLGPLTWGLLSPRPRTCHRQFSLPRSGTHSDAILPTVMIT